MNISDFVGKISRYGFMRNHRWTIMFGRAGVDNERLSTMCQGVTLPGRGFEFNDIRTYGPGRKIASSQTYGEELKMEFLCGNDMYERQVFTNWLDSMVNPITNNVNYYSSYICDATVRMYDLQNNLRYAVKFYEVYPSGLDSTELLQGGDDPHVKISVGFNYRKFVNLQAEVAVASGEERNMDDESTKSAPKTQEPATATAPTVEKPRGGTNISYKSPPGEYTSNDPNLSQEEMKSRMDASKARRAERRRQRRGR